MIQLLSNYENIIIRTRSFRALNEKFRKITYTSLALLEIKKKTENEYLCSYFHRKAHRWGPDEKSLEKIMHI